MSTVPSVPELAPLQAPELVRPDVTISDNGEHLVPVKDALRLHPVYSWLGFDHVPEDILIRAGLVERLVAASRELLEDGAPGLARDLRRLLASVLRRQGMVPIAAEWWHWSYGDQYWARTTGEATAVYGEAI